MYNYLKDIAIIVAFVVLGGGIGQAISHSSHREPNPVDVHGYSTLDYRPINLFVMTPENITALWEGASGIEIPEGKGLAGFATGIENKEGVCNVFVPPIEWDESNTDPYQYSITPENFHDVDTLVHEIRHCLQGHFHEAAF